MLRISLCYIATFPKNVSVIKRHQGKNKVFTFCLTLAYGQTDNNY
jgi:hypothetical protein